MPVNYSHLNSLCLCWILGEIVAKRLTGNQRSTDHQTLLRSRQPQLNRAVKNRVLNPPLKWFLRQATKRVQEFGSITLTTIKLIVQQKIPNASLESLKRLASHPREIIRIKVDTSPIRECLRLRQSHLLQLGPDGDARVWCEKIRRKANVIEAAGHPPNNLHRLLTVPRLFARKTENQIEGDADACARALRGGFKHIGNVLVALVHVPQNFG